MKKTCNGCKALEDYGCTLSYNTYKVYKDVLGWPTHTFKPKEECPKPKTNKSYMYEVFNYKGGSQ